MGKVSLREEEKISIRSRYCRPGKERSTMSGSRGGRRPMWVSFQYQKLPKFCFQCCRIKHGEQGCMALSSNQMVDSVKKYGVLLRAQPPNRQQGSFGSRDGILTAAQLHGDGGESEQHGHSKENNANLGGHNWKRDLGDPLNAKMLLEARKERLQLFGVLKVNWDAAMDKQNKKMGIGVIVRDHEGGVLRLCVLPNLTLWNL